MDGLGAVVISPTRELAMQIFDVLRVVGRTQAVGTVAAALALGVRHIDTAPLYGAGLSEEYIGDALAEAGLGATEGLRVWSKAGVVRLDCNAFEAELNVPSSARRSAGRG